MVVVYQQIIIVYKKNEQNEYLFTAKLLEILTSKKTTTYHW